MCLGSVPCRDTALPCPLSKVSDCQFIVADQSIYKRKSTIQRKIFKTMLKITRLTQSFILAFTLSLLPFGWPSIAQPIPAVERSLLTIGSQGEAVIELQAVLVLMGYYNGEVDGIYAANTAEAVKKFQQDAGLNPDGIAGEDTWTRLFPATEIADEPAAIVPDITNINPTNVDNPTAAIPLNVDNQVENQIQSEPSSADWQILRVGMEGSAVMGLQQRLTSLGFYSGEISGVFDAQTEAAVKAAQEKFNLPADGTVGPATWNALMQ